MLNKTKILFIGGGAAGFFGALRAAQVAKDTGKACEVFIYESSGRYLKKVQISGGGRCNVTHHQFDSREFVKNYPRGSRELISAFHRFQAEDMVAWLERRGVRTKYESDGRMFPVTDSSGTIIDCFQDEARRLKVKTIEHQVVNAIDPLDNGFDVYVKGKGSVYFDKVMICTGSSPGGYRLAEHLGHTITERAPSLFSFKIKSALLNELSGLSFPNSEVILKIDKKTKFKEQGPLLITHWGLSGPAVLKISAWAAREMKRVDYKAQLTINWLGLTREQISDQLDILKSHSPKSLVKNEYIEQFPKRFWLNLLNVSGVQQDLRWAEVTKKQLNKLLENIAACPLEVLGQNRFKDEFVECGGVSLKEIDFKTMQSKKHKGLYFSGEILDVDGITGGFNFQNAWTGSWIAGEHMVLNE